MLELFFFGPCSSPILCDKENLSCVQSLMTGTIKRFLSKFESPHLPPSSATSDINLAINLRINSTATQVLDTTFTLLTRSEWASLEFSLARPNNPDSTLESVILIYYPFLLELGLRQQTSYLQAPYPVAPRPHAVLQSFRPSYARSQPSIQSLFLPNEESPILEV